MKYEETIEGRVSQLETTVQMTAIYLKNLEKAHNNLVSILQEKDEIIAKYVEKYPQLYTD